MDRAQRLHHLDWLRVLAMLGGLLFHASYPFAPNAWIIKNAPGYGPATSVWPQLVIELLSWFRMPLLFLVSGAGTFFALGRRSGRVYAVDRIRRLLVPLVFGVLVVVPPQVFLERRVTWPSEDLSPVRFDGSYWFFLTGPWLTQGLYPQGNLTWLHLWFLFYLLVFSLLTLPLLLWWRSPRGSAHLERWSGWLARGRRVWLLGLPLLLIGLALRGRFPQTNYFFNDPAYALHYGLLFVCGYVIYASPRLTGAVNAQRGLALLVALGLLAVRLALPDRLVTAAAPYSAVYFLSTAVRMAGEFALVLAVLGWASVALNRPGAALRYAGALVSPFYIWHQTVIVVVAFWAVQLPMAMWPKYALVLAVSLALTVALSELVSRVALLRPCFGVRSRRAGPPPSREAAAD